MATRNRSGNVRTTNGVRRVAWIGQGGRCSAQAFFGGSSRDKARATQNDLLERQNSEQLDSLSEQARPILVPSLHGDVVQVAMLKNLTMEIDQDVTEQNSFLESMSVRFAGAGEVRGCPPVVVRPSGRLWVARCKH